VQQTNRLFARDNDSTGASSYLDQLISTTRPVITHTTTLGLPQQLHKS